MLKNLEKELDCNDISLFKIQMESEFDIFKKGQLISNLLPQEQFQYQNQMVSILNQYLMRSCSDRQDLSKNKLIMQVIIFLCKTRADIQIQQVGTYYCNYCNEKFQDNEIDAEIFDKKTSDNSLITQTILTLKCGHTLHIKCFQELIEHFKRDHLSNGDQEIDCECPGCNQNEGKIKYSDILKLLKLQKK